MGVEAGDVVGIDISGLSLTYDYVDAGPGIPMSSTGTFSITGADALNYRVETFFGDINPKTLSVEGLTGVDKAHNGSTDATATGTPNLIGVVGSEAVTLSGVPLFVFASAEVGTEISITTTGYAIQGTDAFNYQHTQPTLSADITTTLGVEASTLKGVVTMYPNPVKDQLTIESNKPIEQIGLFNVLGQEVRSFKPQDTLIRIDVSNLNTGVYFIYPIAIRGKLCPPPYRRYL